MCTHGRLQRGGANVDARPLEKSKQFFFLGGGLFCSCFSLVGLPFLHVEGHFATVFFFWGKGGGGFFLHVEGG